MCLPLFSPCKTYTLIINLCFFLCWLNLYESEMKFALTNKQSEIIRNTVIAVMHIKPWYNKEQLQNKTPEKQNNQFKSIYQVRLLPQIAFENYTSQFSVCFFFVYVKQWLSKFYPQIVNRQSGQIFDSPIECISVWPHDEMHIIGNNNSNSMSVGLDSSIAPYDFHYKWLLHQIQFTVYTHNCLYLLIKCYLKNVGIHALRICFPGCSLSHKTRVANMIFLCVLFFFSRAFDELSISEQMN